MRSGNVIKRLNLHGVTFSFLLVACEILSTKGLAGKFVRSPLRNVVHDASTKRIDYKGNRLFSTLKKHDTSEEEAPELMETDENWIFHAFDAGDESLTTPVDEKAPEPRAPRETKSPPPQLDAQPFPMSMIVEMEDIKKALILAAINPRMGGVVVSGRRGTGKSVVARAVHRLLPKYIERVKGNPYNVDPNGENGIDSFLENELLSSGIQLQDMVTELVRTPFVEIPLNVMEDSLLGTVDLERSMQTGLTEFSPGLLARAHRGVLYVDDVNLLDEEAANILLNVIADGQVTVEREGLSVTYPCRPILIATYNPEEGELREHLLDRIGVALFADVLPLSVADRVQVVENVLGFSGGTQEQSSKTAKETMEQVEQEEQDLQLNIVTAMAILPDVQITHDQILYLCEEATLANCEGQRAEIFAAEVAKTSAALDGRTKVNAQDLQTAVFLAIGPRANLIPMSDEEEVLVPPAPPQSSLEPLPPPPDQLMDDQREEEEQEETQQEEEQEDTSDEMETEPDKDSKEEDIEIPLEFMFGVDMTPIDPKLLYFNKWTRKGKGGKRSRIFNLERGRFVKAIFPKANKSGKLAVAATLRAAAPYQKLRRKLRALTGKRERPVYINKDDFRIKRMAKKAGSLIIFTVDASGSMALNRMDAAKGAALTLLSEAYKSRDKISLIAFHDKEAEVLVPTTKSMALTKNRLEGMPCGGGSPLSHALTLAMRTGLNAIKVKQDVGRVIVVLLSDGRANIPMCTSMGDAFDPIVDPESKDGLPSRSFLKEEALAVAKKLGSLADFNMLCIDTEDRFVGTGIAREIAKAARGNYFHIVDADSSVVSHITKKGLEAASKQDKAKPASV